VSYATLQQLASAYGSIELTQKLNDELPLLTEQMLNDYCGDALPGEYTEDELAIIASAAERVDAVLSRQSQFMDSFIAKRYTLPLSDTVIANSPLNECCLVLSRAAMSDDANNLSEVMANERDYWRAWLKQVAKGDVVLVGADSAQTATGEVQRNYKTAAIKSSINWDGYP
jgi:phage gp36-like protein